MLRGSLLISLGKEQGLESPDPGEAETSAEALRTPFTGTVRDVNTTKPRPLQDVLCCVRYCMVSHFVSGSIKLIMLVLAQDTA